MYKNLFLLILFVSLLLTPWLGGVSAQEPVEEITETNIYFFWGEGCPHCSEEKLFLDKLTQNNENITVHDYEVWGSKENQELLGRFSRRLDVNISGVPFTVVGGEYFTGWYNEEITGTAIIDAVKCVQRGECQSIGDDIVFNTTDKSDEKKQNGIAEDGAKIIPESVHVPLLGEIETRKFSLPVLTMVLGAIDGFNPCAMWALLFLISLLLGMKDRKRMWILGTAFIFTSALVYFTFMAAWLNLILFIGIVAWVRIIIGLIALLGGGYNLKEYFTSPAGVCKVSGGDKKQKFFEKLKDVTKQKNFYIALGGIVVLAFAVNLIELICSAGLPAVYTQVLALSDLSILQYYLYLLFYVFIFMLDDLIVFIIAMKTLEVTGFTAKYSKWSHLIGGILMIAIGLLLIFRPELLMFG